ncbi:hypothetical protein LR004_01520 [Candidatus Gracilibacteria bacterium]|nr:hypothetical protein [Candidatus Gracilibacteria bacterium]
MHTVNISINIVDAMSTCSSLSSKWYPISDRIGIDRRKTTIVDLRL